MYDRNKEYIQTVHYLLYAVVILFFLIWNLCHPYFIIIQASPSLQIYLVEVQ